MNNELIKRIENKANNVSLDDTLREMLLTKSLAEIAGIAEMCSTQRIPAACTLIFNAIFSSKQKLVSKDKNNKQNKPMFTPDIGLINELIKRIDGAIPESDEREKYANLLGDALDEVLDSNDSGISFNDLGIVAMAKAILYVALNENPNMGVQEKRDRQTATEIWLSRTGGRRSKPESASTKILYVDRDFTKSLEDVDKNN